jgi:phosphoribosyl 1,2-cyclic phosphate phosphodiesterase
MRAVFLGTGTSVGVPMIGCDCPVCRSADPRNRRRRAGFHVQSGDVHVVVDTSPDFREQALTFQIPRVDAVLFTHGHADHIFGFDDIRRFNTVQNEVIPAYGHPDTLASIQRIFDYIGASPVPGLYRPLIEFRAVTQPFDIGPLHITPFEVLHDEQPTLGYLFREGPRSLAYVPDCLEMDEAAIALLRGVNIMILDALRHRPHRTHMTLARSLETLAAIGAERGFLTHMCHDLDHAQTERSLPANIRLAYDGLTIDL